MLNGGMGAGQLLIRRLIGWQIREFQQVKRGRGFRGGTDGPVGLSLVIEGQPEDFLPMLKVGGGSQSEGRAGRAPGFATRRGRPGRAAARVFGHLRFECGRECLDAGQGVGGGERRVQQIAEAVDEVAPEAPAPISSGAVTSLRAETLPTRATEPWTSRVGCRPWCRRRGARRTGRVGRRSPPRRLLRDRCRGPGWCGTRRRDRGCWYQGVPAH